VSRGTRLRFWGITAVALAVIGVTTALGAWQLGRAHQRLALEQALLRQQQRAPVGEQALLGATPATHLLQRPIVVRGTWAPRHTVFLDNRQMEGKVGFFVVTPLLLEGSGRPVLVERGWVQRNFERRDALPAIPTPAGVVTVHGRIAPPPPKLYDFGGPPTGVIRQNIDLPRFRAETGLPLLDLAVRQTGADPADGLLRDWPEPAGGAETNYGYAFQWWSLAALTAILYAWFQLIAPRRKARHA
jgi:surfeit locus 1 family protein